MNVHRSLSTVLLVLVSIMWIYRDVVAQVCNGLDSGCVQNVTIPCTQGGGTCLNTTDYTPPGGVTKCDDGATASFYTFVPPTAWSDCVPKTGKGPCKRTAADCGTVYLYEIYATCELGDPEDACGSNVIQACTMQSGQPDC